MAAVLLALPLAAQETESRVWTNREGRTVKAKLIEVSAGNAVLELEDGTRSSVPLASLSDPDQVYLQTMPGGRPAESHANGPLTGGAQAAGSAAPPGPLAWPGPIRVDARALAVQEGRQDAVARQYHYQTGGFGFIANAPLAGSVLQGVAADFELARAAVLQMPWGWQPRPKEGAFFKVYLTETLEDYIALGGDDRSGADSKEDYVFIKFSSLGLKKVGQRYAFDARGNDPQNVVQMTTRLLLGEMGPLLDPWLRNGLEQLMGRIAYHRGALRFSGLVPDLKDYVNHYARYNVQPDMQRMLAYLRAGYVTRTREVLLERHQRQFDAVLLTYYFGFLEGEGSGARLHQFLREAAQEGLAWRAWRDTQGKSPRPRDASAGKFSDIARSNTEKFLQGRTDAQLAADIAAKYQANGIKF